MLHACDDTDYTQHNSYESESELFSCVCVCVCVWGGGGGGGVFINLDLFNFMINFFILEITHIDLWNVNITSIIKSRLKGTMRGK